jgi:hypothetical protein
MILIGPGFGIECGHAQQAQKPDLTAAGLWLEWYRPTEVIVWRIRESGGAFEASIVESIRPSARHTALDVIKPEDAGRFDIRHLRRHGLAYEDGELLSPNGRVADIKIMLSPDGQTAVIRESNFGTMVNGVRKPDAKPHNISSGLARLD